MRVKKRYLFFGFMAGYALTFIGMTIEEIMHGMKYAAVLFSWHHYLYPIITGIALGWYVYQKESEKINFKKEKEKWEDLVGQSGMGFFVSTPEKKIKFVNSALLTMLGDSVEEFEQLHLPQICTTELLLTGKYVGFMSLKTKTGKEIEMRRSLYGHYDKNKKLVLIMGSLEEKRFFENKQLIIPVCAYCKKMIQKNNQWFPAIDALMFYEEEIKKHEGNIAQSHGICPECEKSMHKIMKEIKK